MQVDPLTQPVAPVKPIPPHWPHLTTVPPPDGGGVGVGSGVGVDAGVDAGVDTGGCCGVPPPPLQVKGRGPGMVYEVAPA